MSQDQATSTASKAKSSITYASGQAAQTAQGFVVSGKATVATGLDLATSVCLFHCSCVFLCVSFALSRSLCVMCHSGVDRCWRLARDPGRERSERSHRQGRRDTARSGSALFFAFLTDFVRVLFLVSYAVTAGLISQAQNQGQLAIGEAQGAASSLEFKANSAVSELRSTSVNLAASASLTVDAGASVVLVCVIVCSCV